MIEAESGVQAISLIPAVVVSSVTRVAREPSAATIQMSRRRPPASFQRNATRLLSGDQVIALGAVPVTEGSATNRSTVNAAGVCADAAERAPTRLRPMSRVQNDAGFDSTTWVRLREGSRTDCSRLGASVRYENTCSHIS